MERLGVSQHEHCKWHSSFQLFIKYSNVMLNMEAFQSHNDRIR